MRRLLFRVDANSRIGWGHLTRCLAIADVWRDVGGRASFVIRRDRDSTTAVERVRSHGHAWFPMTVDAATVADQRITRSIATAIEASWVVVDGYHFTPDFHCGIRASGVNLAVIDDTGHLTHYPVDVLINSGPAAERIDYQCDRLTKKLLGTQFLPLRHEIQRWRRQRDTEKRDTEEIATRVLVSLGGGDATGHLITVIETLSSLDHPELMVQIIAGPSCRPNSKLLSALARIRDPRIQLIEATEDLPRRMAWADVAISGAGTTLWELAFIGVPSLALVMADNQLPIAEALAGCGAAVSLGSVDQVSPTRIASTISALLNDSATRRAMSAAGRRSVDGRGAQRIVQALLVHDLRLRPAVADDCLMIWQWANDPDARAASYDPRPIPWDTHQGWFAAQREAIDSLFFVAQDAQGNAIGQVRFHRRDSAAVTSISVERRYRGQGYGSRMIRKGACEAFSRWPSIARIEAEVKASNGPSLRAFELAGFQHQRRMVRSGTESVLFQLMREDAS